MQLSNSKSKTYLYIILCALFGTITISGMYLNSPISKKEYKANFTREYILNNYIHPTDTLDIKFNSYYISGFNGNTIFLGNPTAPLHLLSISIEKQDTQHITIKLPAILEKKIDPSFIKIKIQNQNYYISQGSHPIVLQGTTGNWHSSKTILDKAYFEDIEPISTSSFISRSYNRDRNEYDLAKLSNGPIEFKFHREVLEKQIDGIFCVDGFLLYNQNLRKIIYLYRYRNQFTICDTSLNILYRGHTIDTFKHAAIKIAKIPSQNTTTLTSASTINSLTSTDENYLYVKSNVISITDVNQEYKKGSIIDIYDITNGSYYKSIFISNYKNNNLIEFAIKNKRLFALFDKYLLIYSIDTSQKTNS